MDAKILTALNNLTDSLDAIAEALKNKSAKSDAGKILQAINNVDKKISSISTGIKGIKKDTQQILKNQETLIKLSRDKSSKTEVFETSSDKKSKIKDGVSTVLLIAAGVLAIGLAFKIIGHVDFFSVIALSIALPIIAKSFEIIAGMKLKKGDMINLFFVTVTMAASLTAASWIMSLITPISITQSLTAILIAGSFALMGMSIDKITKGVRDVRLIDLIKVPLVMVVMGYAITQASHIMQDISPISIAKGFTAIMLAATFALIGYSIGQITKNLKDVTVAEALLMPLILIPATFAIVVASHIIQKIAPITLKQGLSAIGTAIVLSAMALPLIVLSYAVKKTSVVEVALMTIILPLLSTAIWLSSMILANVTPVDTGLLWNIVLQSLAYAVMTVALGVGIYALQKLGVTPVTALEGGISIVIIAGAMALSSKLIAMGDYTNGPSIDWAIGTGLSIAAFGAAVMLIGSEIVATAGLGLLAVAAGALAVIVIAKTIVESAAILNGGSYGNYPTLDWALGVGLSLAAFGTSIMLIGGLVVGSFGLGLIALAAGAVAINTISQAIVDSSNILKTGTYTGGPTEKWANGIALSLGAFAPIFKLLFDRGIIGLFSKGPSMEDFVGKDGKGGIIRGIAESIVAAADFFANSKASFTGGPSKDWAEGVGGAIGAFAPVFEAVSKSKSFFGGGISIEEFIGTDGKDGIIVGICKAIVSAAQYFNSPGIGDIFNGGPDEKWSNKISTALSAFAPVFDYLSKNNGWFSNPSDDLLNAITNIAQGIVSSANKLAEGNYAVTIPDDYMDKLGSNIKKYIELVDYLKEKDLDSFSLGNIFDVTSGLARLAGDYEKLAKGVKSLGSALKDIELEKIEALNKVTGSVILMSLMDPDQFEKMMDALESKAGIFVSTIKTLQDASTNAAGQTPTTNFNQTTGSGKNNGTSEIVGVLNTIATNTSGLSTLSKSIDGLKTSLTSLIHELQKESSTRKTGNK